MRGCQEPIERWLSSVTAPSLLFVFFNSRGTGTGNTFLTFYSVSKMKSMDSPLVGEMFSQL